MIRNVFLLVLLVAAMNVAAARIADAFAGTTPPVVNGKAYLFPLFYHDAEEVISRALADRGAGEKIRATMNGRKSDPMFYYSGPMTVETRGLTFDAAARHWTANILIVSGGEVITALPAAGRFDEMAEVPVLRRAIRNGDVIRADDVEIRDIPAGQIRGDTITDLAGLVGKSPARSISANRPVRGHEIGQPAMVKKNSVVQMRYFSPGMEITTTGQALDDGAQGGLVTVRNLTSKKVVQAVVEGEGVVSVSTHGDDQRARINSHTGAAYAAN